MSCAKALIADNLGSLEAERGSLEAAKKMAVANMTVGAAIEGRRVHERDPAAYPNGKDWGRLARVDQDRVEVGDE